VRVRINYDVLHCLPPVLLAPPLAALPLLLLLHQCPHHGAFGGICCLPEVFSGYGQTPFLHAFRPFGGRGARSNEERKIGLRGAAEATTYCPIFRFVRDVITQHNATP
jgi:hypothetical protein